MAEKEYIERGALLDRLSIIASEVEYADGKDDYLFAYGTLTGIRKSIIRTKSTPAADVVEVRHGEWEIKTDDYDCEYMMCSCCKEEFYPVDEDTVDATPKYCPNCGAKMDGKRKEQ
jgi:hypothetical protein